MRHSLYSRSGVVELLGICLDCDIESVQKIVEGQALLQISRFVQGIIQRITVQAESLEIKKGTVVIEPEKPDRDIFDLPPDQLKKLVQGFIWRDEHFSGIAIEEIALRENYSQSYVGTAIFDTFNISQAA